MTAESSQASGPRAVKLRLVSVEQGTAALGFRRVAAVARQLDPAAGIHFVPTGNLYSMMTHLFPARREGLEERESLAIAAALADADLVCFSSMSPSAPTVELLIRDLRRANPGVFVLWGGAHACISPEEAILHADAVCIGEGEGAFREFYEAFSAGRDPTRTAGFWFRRGEEVVRNPPRPLATPEELGRHPHPLVGFDCEIFDAGKGGFRPYTRDDYLAFNGLAYRALWTLGCPFSCAYCANDAFIRADPGHRRIRFPPVEHLLGELEQAIRIHPYVSTIAFYDDNFIAIPTPVLEEFAREYKRRIGLPFVVFGLHPNFVTEEKIALLAEAGMNRGRMGIQSASVRTLKFYNRPTSPEAIRRSANVLARAARRYGMIPPAYDVISDNPVEDRVDVVETIRFLSDLERPFTLTVFSLRAFEKTRLWDYFRENLPVDTRVVDSSYLDTRPSMANVLLHLLAAGRPPRRLVELLLGRVRGFQEEQELYPRLHLLAKSLRLFRRGLSHLRRADFTTIGGRIAYAMWKLGIAGGKRKVAASP
jgi:anaerobic magnesium-protoporphyrin IX monomethyl ester cyclase